FDLGIYDSEGDCCCQLTSYKKQIKEDPDEKSYLYNRAFFEIEEYEILQVIKRS
ncbi:10995_t:CDS:1, partial [Cetraspora pellucida]